MTCLGDLYNLPVAEVRAILVREELTLMNANVREALYRAESLSMPANVGDANPCAELAEAGAYLEDVV